MITLSIIFVLQICSVFSEHKNVILIIADDFRLIFRVIINIISNTIPLCPRPNLGVLGEGDHFSSPAMSTPNLDALAGRSLVLTNAYTQVRLNNILVLIKPNIESGGTVWSQQELLPDR